MTGHEIDIILRVPVHAPSLGYYVADVFMVFFQSSLLIGNIGIAVKHPSTLCSRRTPFDVPWVFEFGTIVGQDDGEVLLEHANPDSIAKTVDCGNDASLGAILKQDNDHKAATPEEQCQKTLADGTVAFYCIHLDNA